MDNTNKEIVTHPQLLDMLFAHKSEVSDVFADILGLYDISHIAVAQINRQQELLILSSTPALEFNLFSTDLWQFDQTYQASWFSLCSQASWQSLYAPERYDELYYLKQIKHHYPFGLSWASKSTEGYVIYSVASQNNRDQTRELFTSQLDKLYKIGQYCNNTLQHLFKDKTCQSQR